MKKLETENQFKDLTAQEKTIFLFSADWCPDCRIIEPILPEIEQKYKDWTFVYVDRDPFIDICAEYNIFGIPSFLAFDKGKEVGRFVSKDAKTQQEIEDFINQLSV
ncbi:thioredoxin family protein [Halobacillus sp. Marseille-Q1614]|uniref:thioredoxin family protein n=1 Tax=Halobacillus sp. Marseille-Q1614 TaxID=2709134 RepID=UPI0015715C41|nr:thioredoxin family protein [Halobacillus sp. Marseille-Q1614]